MTPKEGRDPQVENHWSKAMSLLRMRKLGVRHGIPRASDSDRVTLYLRGHVAMSRSFGAACHSVAGKWEHCS